MKILILILICCCLSFAATPGVYIKEVPANWPKLTSVSTSVAAFVGYTQKVNHNGKSLLNVPAKVASVADFERLFGGAPPDKTKRLLYNSVLQYFQNGGDLCFIVTVGSYYDSVQLNHFLKGIEALEKEFESSTLVIPEAVLLPTTDYFKVEKSMLYHCGEITKRCFGILDVKRGLSISDFRKGIGSQNLGYGAVYYPWLVLADSSRLPPSSAIAGVYARIDNNRGVWKAPANVGLNSDVIPEIDISGTQQENFFNPVDGKAVNLIRQFEKEGTLVWGARTLWGNSFDWRYINIRRTVTMVETTLNLALRSFQIEINSPKTWAAIKGLISHYLEGLWRSGALAGASPDQAFSVQVGLGETMTQQDIQEGILRVNVLLAPAKPAEFMILKFQQNLAK